jgi:hypothetical protein
MAIINTATAKILLGITGTSEDVRLDALCKAVDRAIKVYLGRDIERGSYAPGSTGTPVENGVGDSGYYSGDNSRFLILRQRPIVTVTSIYLDATGRFGDNPDGAFASDTLLVAGTDYVVHWDATLPGTSTRCSERGYVERINGVWPAAWRYTAGTINPTLGNHQGNIKVTYTAGYSTVPPDIQYAASTLVARIRRTAIYGTGHLEMERYEDYLYKLAPVATTMLSQVGELNQLLGKNKDLIV